MLNGEKMIKNYLILKFIVVIKYYSVMRIPILHYFINEKWFASDNLC